MNTAQTQLTIIAIGGGGFTHETDPDLEDFILAQSPVKHPNIGFIGAASHDSPSRIDLFYQRFLGTLQSTSHLLQSASIQEAKKWVSQQDIIYVGGGNTQHLLSYFRKNQLDQVLAMAANSGTILAGVSAGAVCWYEFALSDAGGHGLKPLPGLGLIAGSCCPHYSSEPKRQIAFQQQISNGDLPNGIGIDDGVAVLTRSGQPPRFYTAREALGAYAVEKRAHQCISKRIPPIE
jgi:peptidase E